VGHIDIEAEEVDQQRIESWASDWVGDAKKARAYSDAIRLAYTEMARGEAQAEMILAIANAFEGVDLTNSSKENLRKLIMVRTAQILDALRDNNRNSENQNG
jgi:hypothetical protein